MGTLKQGILGGFSGKVGTVIGFTRNGISYIRGLMTSHTDANTLAQQEQRTKFSLVVKFLRPLVGLLRMSFKKAGLNMSGFNAAVSYTLGHAIAGVFPAFNIDYTKLRVSEGNLPGALNPAAESTQPATINFTWDDNSSDFGAKATDRVLLVVYCPLIAQFASVVANSTRVLGNHSMVLPAHFGGQQVETYIGFANAGMTELSNGVHLDSVVVL